MARCDGHSHGPSDAGLGPQSSWARKLFSGNAVRCSRDRSDCCGCGYSAPASEANEVTDCPKLYPVVGYLAHCKDMCKELGVPENSDVSLVYVRAQGLECCIVLLHSKSVAGESR